METNDNNNKESVRMGWSQIFSHIDTQSAIMAALVISVGTFLLKYLFELCEFIYWRSYFKRFYIPFEYFDEAIIPETGMKYIIILYVPVVVALWWCLNTISKAIHYLKKQEKISRMWEQTKEDFKFIKKWDRNKWYVKCINVVLIFCVYLVLFLLVLLAMSYFWSKNEYYHIGLILFVEIIFYVFNRICRNYFGNYFSFSKNAYYFYVRIIGGVISIYLVLGCVFFVGSFSNSGAYLGEQGVRLVNESYNSFRDVKAGDKLDVKMVLLETEDYYYVTNAELENRNGRFCLNIWSVDTYRFIDKVDCPITTEYVSLWYYSTLYDENIHDLYFDIYFGSVFAFIFIIVCFLNIPVRKENEKTNN